MISRPNVAACIRVVLAGLLLLGASSCGGGGGPPPGGTPSVPGSPYRLPLTADMGQGVVTDVLEQGDRYEILTDPAAISQQEQDMLAILTAHQTWVALGTFSYPEFDFYPNGTYWWTDNIGSPHSGPLTPFTVGLYTRNGSSTPLLAACIPWHDNPFEPAMIVIVTNTQIAHATVGSDGVASVLFYDQY